MRTVAALFWEKVVCGPGCWEWSASRNGMGYGQFRVGSKRDGTHRCALAHRVSWELANGPIPSCRCVLHRCDNPACVRPDHLFLGTRPENSADMVSKGRQRSGRMPGETNPFAKLTSDAARAIRERGRAGETGASLARAFGVSKATACRIIRGERWA